MDNSRCSIFSLIKGRLSKYLILSFNQRSNSLHSASRRALSQSWDGLSMLSKKSFVILEILFLKFERKFMTLTRICFDNRRKNIATGIIFSIPDNYFINSDQQIFNKISYLNMKVRILIEDIIIARAWFKNSSKGGSYDCSIFVTKRKPCHFR